MTHMEIMETKRLNTAILFNKGFSLLKTFISCKTSPWNKPHAILLLHMTNLSYNFKNDLQNFYQVIKILMQSFSSRF